MKPEGIRNMYMKEQMISQPVQHMKPEGVRNMYTHKNDFTGCSAYET